MYNITAQRIAEAVLCCISRSKRQRKGESVASIPRLGHSDLQASKMLHTNDEKFGCAYDLLESDDGSQGLIEGRTHEAYIKRVIAEGYTQHRFHRVQDWESQYGPITPQHNVLKVMKADTVYSLIVVDNAVTSVVGPASGVVHPTAIAKTQVGPALLVTGGFFIHKAQFFKPRGGMPYGDNYLHWTVGETSLTPNWVPVDSAYGDVMKKRIMSDGSFITSGPTLNDNLDLSRPHFTEASTSKMRFQYDAYDENGQLLPNPMAGDLQHFDKVYQEMIERMAKGLVGGPSLNVDVETLKAGGRHPMRNDSGNITLAAQAPSHPFIRTPWAFVPANLSHASQPNERCGITHHSNGVIVSHACTSLRKKGLDLNEFRALMIAGTEYLGFPFQEIGQDDVWANDGGGSIFQIFEDQHGTLELFACGGQAVQNYPLDISTTDMRDVPHAILIRSLAGLVNKVGRC